MVLITSDCATCMSAGGSSSSDEALRSVPLPEDLPLARPPPGEVVPDPVPHRCVGCGRTAPPPWHLEQAAAAGRPVPAANGRCIQCTALEDLRVACLTLDRESFEARHIVEVCWSLRRLAGSGLFNQAIEGGPGAFSEYLDSEVGRVPTHHPTPSRGSEP